MTEPDTYPVRVTADIDRPLSRWLWLDMGGHEQGTAHHAAPA